MKVLPKLIAFCCAVCMVGMVWGAEWYKIFIFGKDEKWNVIIKNKNLLTEYLVDENKGFTRAGYVEGAKNSVIHLFYTQEIKLEPSKEDCIPIDASEEEYKKINQKDSELLFGNNGPKKNAITLIKEMLPNLQEEAKKKREREEQLEYAESVRELNLEQLEKKLEEAKTENNAKHVNILEKRIKIIQTQALQEKEEEQRKQKSLSDYEKLLGKLDQSGLDIENKQLKKEEEYSLYRQDYLTERKELYNKELEKRKQVKTSETTPLSVPQTDQSILDLTKALRDLYFGKVK